MERVGWVERSETHHLVRQEAILMGFVSLNPSYPLSERRAIRQGRLAPSKGIAWNDNRSLISSRVNIPLGFLGMVFATYEHKALPRDVSGV